MKNYIVLVEKETMEDGFLASPEVFLVKADSKEKALDEVIETYKEDEEFEEFELIDEYPNLRNYESEGEILTFKIAGNKAVEEIEFEDNVACLEQ